jgi:hypothetical protein
VRRGALALPLTLVVLLTTTPALALETRTFGLEPARDARVEPGTERLVVEPDRGGDATTAVRLHNRTDQPVILQLSAEAAKVNDDGGAELGGDGRAAGWISFSEDRVELAAGADAIVEVHVRAPRRAGTAERTAAVVAQPVVASGATPAVVERLALVVYVRPGDDNGFGRWALLAAVAVILGALAVALSLTRGRERVG